MGIEYSQQNIHWNYFLAIESDFEKISRYIEFCGANGNTFSIELARIIMSSSQEIDGIMKKLCVMLDPTKTPDKINQYREIIKDKKPEFINEFIEIPRFGMRSQPWLNWLGIENPIWWRANNNIKHNRTENFEQANLTNAFNSVGALLITTCYFYKTKIEEERGVISWPEINEKLNPKPSLFMLKKEYYYDPKTWEGVGT